MDAQPKHRRPFRLPFDALIVPGAILVGVVLFFGGAALADARATPPIALSASTLDLGRVASEGHAKGTVRLVNRSDRAIGIGSVTTSCGCTAADAPKSVPAHGSAILRIDLDASGRRHGFHEGVSVTFEGYESRPMEVEVVGTVGPESASVPSTKTAECRVSP